LLRSFEGGSHRLRYARHLPGVLVETSATLGGPSADEELVSPRALVRDGDGMMHAFFGSPDMSSVGGTKQWVFPEGATTITGTPTDIGPPGAVMIDAARKQDATVNVAVGQISATNLRLKGDQVPETQLATIDTADFNTLVELNSFLDVPNTGEAHIESDAILLVGANSTKDKMVMIVAGVSGGAAITNTELLVPSDAADGFSDVAVFVTNSPISALGGIGRLVYSERYDTGPNA